MKKYLASTAALAVLIASAAFTPETLPDVPLCPSRALFDVPCPGCGLTRAFVAIAHFDFAAAWALHPFSFVFFVLMIALVFLPWWPKGQSSARATRAFAVFGIAFVAVVWIWGVARAMRWRDASAHSATTQEVIDAGHRRVDLLHPLRADRLDPRRDRADSDQQLAR